MAARITQRLTHQSLLVTDCGLQVPQLVSQYASGTLPIDQYITHTFDGVDKVRPYSNLFLFVISSVSFNPQPTLHP